MVSTADEIDVVAQTIDFMCEKLRVGTNTLISLVTLLFPVQNVFLLRQMYNYSEGPNIDFLNTMKLITSSAQNWEA